MGKTKEKIFDFFVLLLCVLAGEAVYITLSKIKSLSFLTTELVIGTQKPIVIDIMFFNFVLGFNLKLNLFTIIGFILGIIFIKRVR
ncbi:MULTISPECIES: DUF4321 domain-containing protein [Caloramator]|uniref:DUF4321 domain-containing protein n=1 Tax=Caloramator proteoclasticus DSM 10124 TaxID=1121262 RepID=A0A1M4TH35_9CLOT|nr:MULTISPECIES: DUF4321 domain-containing protein [Caloramator]SHE43728.1 protein of unknown function [Caloramator proteoclasticus DSM 10124]